MIRLCIHVLCTACPLRWLGVPSLHILWCTQESLPKCKIPLSSVNMLRERCLCVHDGSLKIMFSFFLQDAALAEVETSRSPLAHDAPPPPTAGARQWRENSQVSPAQGVVSSLCIMKLSAGRPSLSWWECSPNFPPWPAVYIAVFWGDSCLSVLSDESRPWLTADWLVIDSSLLARRVTWGDFDVVWQNTGDGSAPGRW